MESFDHNKWINHGFFWLQLFSSEKPGISHLQIFGCPIYMHIPKENRMKMEPSGKKGSFVGYIETSKAFQIYVPGEIHVEVS